MNGNMFTKDHIHYAEDKRNLCNLPKTNTFARSALK
jgi:hypothetical protein